MKRWGTSVNEYSGDTDTAEVAVVVETAARREGIAAENRIVSSPKLE